MDTESQVVGPFVITGPQAGEQGQDPENHETQMNNSGNFVQFWAFGRLGHISHG
jgi:hypothetical protein